MFGKRFIVFLCIFTILSAVTFSGCAFGKFGHADMTYSRMTVPAGLTGRDKGEVLKNLGIPNSVVRENGTEYWDYNNKCGYFALVFGKTIEKDLILELRDGRVKESYLVDKGSSTGILATQGSVEQ